MISSEFGFIKDPEAARILNAIRGAGLPLFSPLLTQRLCEGALDHSVRHRGGLLNLVVPALVGGATFVPRREDVGSALLGRAIAGLRELALDLEQDSRARLDLVPV
jgi:hypothetical protein